MKGISEAERKGKMLKEEQKQMKENVAMASKQVNISIKVLHSSFTWMKAIQYILTRIIFLFTFSYFNFSLRFGAILKSYLNARKGVLKMPRNQKEKTPSSIENQEQKRLFFK